MYCTCTSWPSAGLHSLLSGPSTRAGAVTWAPPPPPLRKGGLTELGQYLLTEFVDRLTD